MKRLLVLGLLSGLLGGCGSSNPYSKFYEGMSISQIESDKGLIKSACSPRIHESRNIEKDIEELKSYGYVVVGHSGFNGPLQDEKKLEEYSKSIHAEVVVLSSEYRNTKTDIYSYPVPSYSRTYGSIGTTNFRYSSYGTECAVGSESRDIYIQTAYYLIKRIDN